MLPDVHKITVIFNGNLLWSVMEELLEGTIEDHMERQTMEKYITFCRMGNSAWWSDMGITNHLFWNLVSNH